MRIPYLKKSKLDYEFLAVGTGRQDCALIEYHSNTKRKFDHLRAIRLHDMDVKRVTEVKYLWITLDQK